MISGSFGAYRYLPESVYAFPAPEALKAMMEEAGFSVRYELLTFGVAAIHVGDKPKAPPPPLAPRRRGFSPP